MGRQNGKWKESIEEHKEVHGKESTMPATGENNFEFAFNYTLKDEGGYSNHPSDKGGPTNYGIIQEEYARYKGHSVSANDVKNMVLSEAKDIYYQKYWLPMSLNKITDKNIACCVFNFGVQFGIGVGKRFAQEVCGVEVDGHIGPITIKAINSINRAYFITEYVKLCKARYKGIVLRKPSQAVFIKGWLNRANRALSLA